MRACGNKTGRFLSGVSAGMEREDLRSQDSGIF